jgi:hypothetical protein
MMGLIYLSDVAIIDGPSLDPRRGLLILSPVINN